MKELDKVFDELAEMKSILKSQSKQILTFEEFCDYAGISKSHGYKLTCSNQIAFYRPHGKLIYLEKGDVDRWLLQNRVKSISEIKAEQDSK